MKELYKIAICEDEKLFALKLESIVRQYFDVNKIDYSIDIHLSGQSLLNARKIYDLLFLDVVMPGLNGNDVAKAIRMAGIHTKIIYVTSLSDQQNVAYEVMAIAYINKPVYADNVFDVLSNVLVPNIPHVESIIVNGINGGHVAVDLNKILYCTLSGNHVITITTSDGTFDIQDSLTGMLNKLGHGFDWPHKSYVVRYDKIKELEAKRIIMVDDAKIPIAFRRYKQFLKNWEEYYDDLGLMQNGYSFEDKE